MILERLLVRMRVELARRRNRLSELADSHPNIFPSQLHKLDSRP